MSLRYTLSAFCFFAPMTAPSRTPQSWSGAQPCPLMNHSPQREMCYDMTIVVANAGLSG